MNMMEFNNLYFYTFISLIIQEHGQGLKVLECQRRGQAKVHILSLYSLFDFTQSKSCIWSWSLGDKQ